MIVHQIDIESLRIECLLLEDDLLNESAGYYERSLCWLF